MAHAAANTTISGKPVLASTPADAAPGKDTDPTEMSISPASITGVIPAAMMRTARFARRSMRLPRPKYSGRAIASAANSTAIAMATQISRRCWFHPSQCPEPSRARAPGWRPRATACRRSSARIRDAIARIRYSGSSEEIISTARRARQSSYRRVDFGFRADVDALCRLVQNENLRRGSPTSAQALPSAGCRRRATRPRPPRTRS